MPASFCINKYKISILILKKYQMIFEFTLNLLKFSAKIMAKIYRSNGNKRIF